MRKHTLAHMTIRENFSNYADMCQLSPNENFISLAASDHFWEFIFNVAAVAWAQSWKQKNPICQSKQNVFHEQ